MSKNYKSHSAYKSMAIAKEGKTKEHDGNLKRWVNEKWQNLTPLTLGDTKFYECGEKSKEQELKHIPSVCRPSKKINKETPKIAKKFNKTQIKKAINIKKKGDYIRWEKL